VQGEVRAFLGATLGRGRLLLPERVHERGEQDAIDAGGGLDHVGR
jgi:hypothetical protein